MSRHRIPHLLALISSTLLIASTHQSRAAITLQEAITPTNVWPVTVGVSTADPALSTVAVGVSPTHIISQTLTPASTGSLDSIYMTYSTAAASAAGSFSVRIQQVSGGSGVQTYAQGTNLLPSSSFTFSLASTAGATRILKLTFTGSDRITLTAGVTYAVEITSTTSAMNLFRRGVNLYPNGACYDNRAAINYPSTFDVAMGIVFTPDTQAPTVPGNLTATAVSSSRIDLTWAASTDNVAVTGYRILRGGTEIATSTTTSYSDTSVVANTTYSYTVSAYDAADNNSAPSSSASATTPSGGGGGGAVTVTQGISPANVWPETVTIATADPAQATVGVAGSSSVIVSQTFTPAAAFNLGNLYLSYSTSAASAANSFTLKIQQVTGGGGVQTYPQSTNLLGTTPFTFSLASTGGAIRLLKFSFTGSSQLLLAGGATYAVEISSTASNVNFYRTGSNPYLGGTAYTNRSAILYPTVRDLGMGVVASGTSTQDADNDGMPNSWEMAYGLNPNSLSDAGLDPDGDGRTNLQEFQMGSNPNVFDNPSNTITVSVDTPNAYELEGTAGRVLVTRSGGTNALTINFTRSGIAGVNDYATKAVNGTTLNGSVSLPAGTNTAYIVIQPTTDTLNEYPETATITLAAGTGYSIGSASSATVNVNDAADVTANEQIFVAPLTPYPGVTSSASGVGTFYLNGPKNRARVSLAFNGLSSMQTNAYIRYGVSGTELRPNLGTGQLIDVIWNIVPAGAITGQQIIDALYQVGGNFVFTNLGTVNYPAGEIKGNWAKEVTGVPYPPPNPPAITTVTGESLNREVARFLTQATFGPNKAEIDALVSSVNTTYGGDRIAAFNAWIDTQLSYDQTKLEPYTRAVDKRHWDLAGLDINAPTPGADYPFNSGMRFGWWLLSTKARDQLRQRFAFAASQIWVVSGVNVTLWWNKYGTSNYYDMLGSYATGNFRDLLESVSKHPVMGQYLSSLRNQKAILDPAGNALVSPDENYAREVMQLFSIGLVQRRMDGVVQLNGLGIPLHTYNNADIKNLARVFTGWGHSKTVGPAPGFALIDNTNFLFSPHGYIHGFYGYPWVYPMTNFPAYHDTEAKTVLGSTIPAGLNGEADLDAAHNILFNHPCTAPFISRLLIQRFVTSNPSPGYIYRVARKFEDNGSGMRGDMKSVLKAILLDYEARTLSLAVGSYGKQKEPLIRFVQALRAFDGKSQLPLTNISAYGYPANQLDNFPAGVTHYTFESTHNRLSQSPFLSPTVFNWYLPDYAPSGVVAQAGLVAPEMQINTEGSVVNHINYLRGLFLSTNLNAAESLYGITDATLDDIIMNLSPVNTVYDNARTAGQTVTQATTTTLDYLDSILMAGSLKATYATAPSPNPRTMIIDGVSSMTMSDTAARVRELLYLVTCTSHYIHQQ